MGVVTDFSHLFHDNSTPSSVGNTIPTTKRATQIISDEYAKLVLKILMYGVTPSISIVGFIGNILSIRILIRHGIHKCFNILLLCLAVADIGLQVGFNSFPKIVYQINGDRTFQFSRPVSHFLYVMYLIFIFFDYSCGMTGLTLPMLITTERLVAVFFPLKFSLIITPLRVWIAVACIYLYWLIYFAYTCFWFQFSYTFNQDLNMTVGLIGRSELFYKDLPNLSVLEEMYFSMKIPPVFTLIGSVMIIVKLKLVASKRLKMTHVKQEQQQQGGNKINQMLLAVCFVYLVTCASMAMPTYIPEEWMAYNLTSEDPSNMGMIMYQVVNIVILANGSWNFFIYVGLNKNFRDTFKEIIGLKKLVKSRN